MGKMEKCKIGYPFGSASPVSTPTTIPSAHNRGHKGLEKPYQGLEQDKLETRLPDRRGSSWFRQLCNTVGNFNFTIFVASNQHSLVLNRAVTG